MRCRSAASASITTTYPIADSLLHAGIADAEIVISSVPDSLLKGTTNERLVRHVRMVNPTAKIIATAEVLAETQILYDAGADYVTIARLDQANELIDVVTAAEDGLLARAEGQDRRAIARPAGDFAVASVACATCLPAH